MSGLPTIIPISDLRQDTAGVIKRAALSHEPVFITQHGRPAAVLVDTQTYERTQRQLQILQLLARGTAQIEAGVGRDMDAVFADADELLGEM
jgi:prevent-host-death family protein